MLISPLTAADAEPLSFAALSKDLIAFPPIIDLAIAVLPPNTRLILPVIVLTILAELWSLPRLMTEPP